MPRRSQNTDGRTSFGFKVFSTERAAKVIRSFLRSQGIKPMTAHDPSGPVFLWHVAGNRQNGEAFGRAFLNHVTSSLDGYEAHVQAFGNGWEIMFYRVYSGRALNEAMRRGRSNPSYY